MRILGIDYGDRHVGLALSDSLQLTAQPLQTIELRARKEDNRRVLADIVSKHDVGRIVIGMPLRMDGSSGTRAEKTKVFGAWLQQALSLPVEFYDERLTTHQAMRFVVEQKVKIKSKRSVVNQIAAVIILQGYLESRRVDEPPASSD
jgi:putative Holliday junction resolvase